MSFKDLLIQAKDGSHYAQEKIFLLYRPLLFKEESEGWPGSAGEVSAILDSLKMFDNL